MPERQDLAWSLRLANLLLEVSDSLIGLKHHGILHVRKVAWVRRNDPFLGLGPPGYQIKFVWQSDLELFLGDFSRAVAAHFQLGKLGTVRVVLRELHSALMRV